MDSLSPDCKAIRLEVLRSYQILDTPQEVSFNDLTQLAAQICQTPVALITFVDADRQWFKSSFGVVMTESPLEDGFCPIVVDRGDRLVIPDTLLEPGFASNPTVVKSPHVRFYAGVPLISANGAVLGTLCVLDFVPRQLSSEQLKALETLSRQVMTQLDLRLTARQIAQRDRALIEVTQAVSAEIGSAFFYSLVQHLEKALDVDYVYIGVVNYSDPETITTIATRAYGEIVDNFEYLLQDTPCKQVIQQRKICCYPRNVQPLFPNAPLLKPCNVESYIAIPFFDSYGTPLGLLGVMDSKPLDQVQLAEALLTISATRIATELERQLAEIERNQLLINEQKARTEAEKANRLKDEFLAMLSHELRTPLNPILGWTKIIKSGRCDATKMKVALETIQRNAELQIQLIEDLLDFSHILQGKITLNAAPVNISHLVTAALDTVRLAATAKSIDLQLHLPSEAISVMGDAARLKQVVSNLLSNAVKFTPNCGQITVSVSSKESRFAEITVRDTGVGIHPEFLPYVFEYFRQQDSSITRKFGGLGLGLAIVQGIVELHGGTVVADSPGSGQEATFSVRLPL